MLAQGASGHVGRCHAEQTVALARQILWPAMKIADVIINGLVEIDYIEVITDKIFSAIDNLY